MNIMNRDFLPNGSLARVRILENGKDLLADHNRYFFTMPAHSPALLKASYALRFQVYCLERRFENADEHPDGLETDAYDTQAVHGLLFHRPSQQAIGTVRLIAGNSGIPDSLPIIKLLKASALALSDYVNLSQTVEISRFAISKEFCGLKPDLPGTIVLRGRETSLAFLSLLQFMLRASVQNNVLFWTAVMEPGFLRLLERIGITYTPIGPKVVHHGIRQPCYCYLPDMLEKARLAQPECWEVLTDGGALHEDFRLTAIASQRESASV